MNIKIVNIELDNFKCFKGKHTCQLDKDVNIIQGRNGVGKTTIADAILWTLFGKNTQGQADFDLKTHDENGKQIPNLDHSVEMVLWVGNEFNAKYITLKRTLKETWIKKRGTDEQVFKNNTTEYLVNGESYTAADYKKYISQLIDEDVFKAITNPTYFPSLKWQVQREFLTKMVGAIVPEEVVDSDDMLEMLKQLDKTDSGNPDIVGYLKHLSYMIKGIKDKLEKIPVRLEEQNKALPELLDWSALESEAKEAYNKIAEIEKNIVAIRSGNGADIEKEKIRAEIKKFRDEMDIIEAEARKTVSTLQTEHDNSINEARQKFNSLLNTQRDLESSIQFHDTLVKRCKETLEQCEKDAVDIRTKWAATQKPFEYDPVSTPYCPTCGQMLPQEQINEKVNKMRQDFNIAMSSAKQALTEQANKVKATRADAEKEIKDLESQKAEAEKKLAETKEAINTVFAEKQKLESMHVTSVNDLLEQNARHKELFNILADLHHKLDAVGVDDDSEKKLEELEAERNMLNENIQSITAKLATREMRLKILALIDGINEEQKDLVKQLSELEKKEDVARRYQTKQNTILEERINKHFSLVKWKMFKTVNNGGDPFEEPDCECYVNGVAYHNGLNQAARLNAGLDIINTLCKHHNVSAPIVLDNSESTINILDTVGQQIRLQVADTDLQVL